ncbi:MAG: shikimate dehydrogenase, partial [Flavobacterium sp.]|nr:shikimate dehydrogenase [Flavobacterium sp.]
MLSAKTKICLIIGDPIEHSLSPLMHNAGYTALGIDDEFVFLAARVKLEALKYVVKAVKAMGIRGLTCTMPHKV